MGYDLHITRAEHWAENAGAEITAAEWQAVVAADPELAPSPELGPGYVRWAGPSRYETPWLAWRDGNVSTKNPDSALLRKMVQLAGRLGARVQGDDGEFYTGDEPLDEYHAGAEAAAGAAAPRSWWRRLLGR